MTDDYAVFFTAPEKAELLAAPRPTTPLAPDEVAGRTLASLVSPGTELQSGYLGERFPSSPGYAAVFEITAVGDDISDLQPGERALVMGPHRSWQRQKRPNVVRVPAGLAPEVATFARLMAVSMTTLTTTAARPPAAVMVSGLGPVGHLAAQLFAGCGYRVLGVDPIASRRAKLEAVGLPAVPAAPLEAEEWRDAIALVVECSGHEQAVLDACQIVRQGGEVVMVGVPWRRRSDLLAFDLLRLVFHRYVHLRSGWEWELPRHPAAFARGSHQGNTAGALDWLAAGRINVDGLLAQAPPADCQEVYQGLLHRPDEHFAVVFDWQA
ncbi:MAG: zinc-binding alcohol dehydrogenase [Armatimonadetes bacterium]|nr:zinc-binding alcohol dehydrogenase [Armatimonadota bacterium]